MFIAVGVVAAVRWMPDRARIGAAALGLGATCVLASLVLAAGGLRWQLLPLGVALPAAITLAWSGTSRTSASTWHRAVVVVAVLSTTSGLAMSAALLWAFPALRFPEPSGPASVGTTVLQWVDRSRDEVSARAAADGRTVVAQIWYPADPRSDTQERATYLGLDDEATQLAAGLANTFGVPAFLFDEAVRARTPAVAEAAVAPGNERFPVVIFSPGNAGVRVQNTAWATDLASHGYVVVALDHPYDSAVAVLEDGTIVRSDTASTGDDDEDERRAVERTRVRAADMRFVLTQLERLDNGDIPSPFDGRLAVDRAAAVGHSLGGAAAIEAALTDARFDAIIDIDGFPRSTPTRAYGQPILAIVAGRGTGNEDSDINYTTRLDAVLGSSAGPAYQLTVPGAAHLSFTDAVLFLPPLPSLVGDRPRHEVLRVTAAASLAFLDHTLRDDPDDISHELRLLGTLSGPSSGP
jgi:predicted dienelactone hydrolase